MNLASLIEKVKNLDNNIKIISILSLVLILLLTVTILSWPTQQEGDLAVPETENNELLEAEEGDLPETEEGELSEATESEPPETEEELPEGMAPDFTLTLLTGETFTLSDHRGTVVVLSFWATWCGPCVVKMPYTQTSAEHFGDQVIFVGINIGENPELVQNFLAEGGYTFPNGVDEDGRIYNNLYTSGGIPYSVIIDKDGMIVHEMVGWAYSMSNQLNEKIEELLR